MELKKAKETAAARVVNSRESIVSIRQFGRIVNCSHTQILRLIKDGIIPFLKNEGVPVLDGVDAFNGYQREKKKGAANYRGVRTDELDKMNADLLLAESKAKLKELEYKIRTGVLLHKVDVASLGKKTANDMKLKLFSIPPRLASICERRSASEIEKLLMDELESALSAAIQKMNIEIGAL